MGRRVRLGLGEIGHWLLQIERKVQRCQVAQRWQISGHLLELEPLQLSRGI